MEGSSKGNATGTESFIQPRTVIPQWPERLCWLAGWRALRGLLSLSGIQKQQTSTDQLSTKAALDGLVGAGAWHGPSAQPRRQHRFLPVEKLVAKLCLSIE